MSILIPLHPDWGTPAVKEDGALGPLVNAAGTLAMVRNGKNARARRTYQAICRHWRTCRDLPRLSDDAQQAECLKRAFAEVGIGLVVSDSPEEP